MKLHRVDEFIRVWSGILRWRWPAIEWRWIKRCETPLRALGYIQ